MVLKNGHFELLYPYAVDLHTGNRVVPFATGRLSSQDTARSFYNEAQHKGHLVCPECETAELVWRKGSAGAGSERITRDHFARRPDSEHDIHCQIGLLGLSYPDPIRFIDERKGGYVYGNFETVLTTAPFRKSFKYRTQLPDKLGHSKPDWIRRVQYGAGYKGFLEIISPDFIDRRRYNAVKDIKGLLELIKRMPRALLADTWVLRNHIAVRLDAMIVREVAPHNRVSQIAEEKQSLGLRHDFLMASDAQYDRFTRLLNAQRLDISFPVVLHFNKAAHPLKITKDPKGQPEIKIDLAAYQVENPLRLRKQWNELALPSVKVGRRIHIKDPALFDVIRGADKEFFALAHPYAFRNSRDPVNGGFFQHFEVLRANDLLPLALADLSASVRSAAEARAELENKRQLRAQQPVLRVA
ncbi:MAG: hypothetical protein AAB276_04165 [Pseudomonadota bacterium]